MTIAQPATQVATQLKVLVWGEAGAGKSRLALSFPAPLVIDLERSTRLYAGEFDFWLAEPTPQRPAPHLVREIAKEIEAGAYPDRQTLVIDPISDYLDKLEAAIIAKLEAQNINLDTLKGPRRAQVYSKINDGIRAELDRLLALPMHVVFVARAKNLWETKDGQMQPTGRIYDAKEIVEYLADVVIHLDRSGEGFVKKSRLAALPERVRAVSYKDIRAALDAPSSHFIELGPTAAPAEQVDAMESAMSESLGNGVAKEPAAGGRRK